MATPRARQSPRRGGTLPIAFSRASAAGRISRGRLRCTRRQRRVGLAARCRQRLRSAAGEMSMKGPRSSPSPAPDAGPATCLATRPARSPRVPPSTLGTCNDRLERGRDNAPVGADPSRAKRGRRLGFASTAHQHAVSSIWCCASPIEPHQFRCSYRGTSSTSCRGGLGEPPDRRRHLDITIMGPALEASRLIHSALAPLHASTGGQPETSGQAVRRST
jgi:hypothetical protein